MAKDYEVCGEDVKELVRRMADKFHPDVIESEVSVECIFCDAGVDEHGEPKPAVKLRGVPCAAVIKRTTVEQRTQGMSDATIIIDKRRWEELTDPERAALIDHELEHIDVQREEDGAVKADSAGRPVIKLKLHDWECAGFRVIAERHKDAALEVQAMIQFEQSPDGQLVFGFKDRG